MRSALCIVCNGELFIKKQLSHIYDSVDEIIIVEGADRIFSKVIGSYTSTDNTINLINNFNDKNNKIKLIQNNKSWGSKNEMVKIGANMCNGNIYHVDVDEFLPLQLINECYNMIESGVSQSVLVPERWFYKWNDTYLSSSRQNNIRELPVRFYKNSNNGLVPSHIPWSGFRNKDGKFINSKCDLPKSGMDLYGYHYLAIYRKQLELKMKYYAERGDCNNLKMKNRMMEFDDFKRKDINTKQVKSYNNSILKIDNSSIIKSL